MAPPHLGDVRLEPTSDTRDLIEELARDLPRAGLTGLLRQLDTAAEPVAVPADAAVEGFTFARRDRRDREWYPQGISWADSSDTGGLDGRSLLVVSWYAKLRRRGAGKGVRLSFVDYTDPQRPRYRHVLLVEPFRDEASGRVDLRPVHVHAGGIVWFGGCLYVAGTAEGIRVFELADLLAVPAEPRDWLRGWLPFAPRGGLRSGQRIGRRRGGHFTAFGYGFVLPQSSGYRGQSGEGCPKLRYSFLSLDDTGDAPHLVAGEYGRRGMTTRLARYPLARSTGRLAVGRDGHSRPRELRTDGVEQMQGAVLVHGRYAITCSRGRTTRGDLWTGRPGALTRHGGVLAAGPEDITYWRSRRQLWTVTEWPARRWVYALDADRWLAGRPQRAE
ncbi:MAG TPA: hypothetical protein VFJ14_16975 [Nocardioidaceae bacterium]|nr:hypothetical protein [Nocardioidaceae bacterium]